MGVPAMVASFVFTLLFLAILSGHWWLAPLMSG